MTANYETHEHDVLIIGAGGAGLRAAIEALANGARVVPYQTVVLSDNPIGYWRLNEH